MRMHNSTIKVKEKICIGCGKPRFIFSKGRCADCARVNRIFEQEEKEVINDEDLSGLIEDADAVFSKVVRLMYADNQGVLKCYTCNVEKNWKQMQCGHYISRKHLYLRWDLRNARPQDDICNCAKHGNLSVFARRLEDENEGITEILLEESRIVYKPTREEIRAVIADFSQRLSHLKNSKK